MVQFQLLHSKFALCSSATRGLLMSTYVKFINLFPEIKGHIQEVSQFLSTLLLVQNFKAITSELGDMLSYINYICIYNLWKFLYLLTEIVRLLANTPPSFHLEVMSSFGRSDYWLFQACSLPVCLNLCFLQIMRSDSNLKNSDAEIQQRALEYLKLSTVASPDVLVSFIIEPLLVIIYKN